MRRWRAIAMFSLLSLPTRLDAQQVRRAGVQASGGVGEWSSTQFTGTTRAVAAALLWRRALGRSDLRAEWTVLRGDSDNGQNGSPCGILPLFPCPRVQRELRGTTVGLAVVHRFDQRADLHGRPTGHLMAGPALLTGRIREDIGPTEATCILGGWLGCVSDQPARLRHHRVRLPAMIWGGGVEVRAEPLNLFLEARGTFGFQVGALSRGSQVTGAQLLVGARL